VSNFSNHSDASFVETNSNYPVSNVVDGYSIAAGTVVIPAIGSLVYKKGNTSGTTSGYTISHTYEGYFSNGYNWVYLTMMVKTSVPCQSGDSGGLLFTRSGSTERVFGILSAADFDPNTGAFLYSYFSNASLLPWDITVIN